MTREHLPSNGLDRTTVVQFSDNSGVTVERLGDDTIRLSWWTSDGQVVEPPLELAESDVLLLFRGAIERSLFSESFLLGLLRAILLSGVSA
jgi:hypothetical protein